MRRKRRRLRHLLGIRLRRPIHTARGQVLISQRGRVSHLRSGKRWLHHSMPPEGQFTSVSAGSGHTCGVKRDGGIVCWGGGTNSFGQATAPEGGFVSVSAGRLHNCGLGTDGSVLCWGNDEFGQAGTPRGRFSSVSAGGDHNCGVREDGSVKGIRMPTRWDLTLSEGVSCSSLHVISLGMRSRPPSIAIDSLLLPGLP